MKDVEFFQWYIPDRLTGKPYFSRWKMSEDHAQKMYPGCKKEPATREVRFIATTEEERIDFATSAHSKIKPGNAGRDPS
ncbi:hypothetical protein H6CHR_01884 [Variovorax sp. PBL-H6]|nr:hypothetical protein H6CHR_01884 [Variovorax sp. PBL-H6]